ncbi:Ser/Thr protein kinase RdoA (MazF antagonist) [Inhella inkyongensis]|uniref:Stress response kinase A n=1 Tax=Inhella inkyongensis TaxID=392593 RepID=A0A840S526_9BURK|nr:serine/threonine protein kinase [Inhella inkyongensis]MBB5204662.1 Ser/Thr protein kinase RdoA (MazF antagonist) [Inhella inkyongensis]
MNLDYAELDPGRVLDALDTVGLRGDGRLLQLNSYENRVFLVHLEDGAAVVAKFYRPARWSNEQLLEEHRFALDLQADEVPLAAPLPLQACGASLLGEPPTLAQWQGLRFCAAPRQGGRAPELEDLEVLEVLGRFIARIHRVGRQREFTHRPRWAGRSPGDLAVEAVRASGCLPYELEGRWHGMVERCLQAVQQAFGAQPGLRTQRLHGDCHPGNLLWTPGGGAHFVDLDDAVTGPAVQDLWMLLSGDPAQAQQQLRALLAGYEQVLDFDRRELTLIEPLRTLRMIHHSGWIAKRWDDPAFPIAFPWFGTPNYWLDQVAKLAEQLEAMQDAPPAPPPKDDDDFVNFDGDGFA